MVNTNGQLGTAQTTPNANAASHSRGGDLRALRRKVDAQASQLRELKAELAQVSALKKEVAELRVLLPHGR